MQTTLRQKLKDACTLFLIFFKIGLFSFGGGYAMITMMERELTEKRSFLSKHEFQNIIAIAESTPGAIAVNIATFVGTNTAGIFGGILATLGVVLPSFIIISALSFIIDIVRDNYWVNCIFRGIRIGVLVLIARAAISFIRNMRKSALDILFLIAAFLIAFLTDVSVIFIILGTILLLIICVLARNLRAKKLHIITDFDAYQKSIIENAQNAQQNDNKEQNDTLNADCAISRENDTTEKEDEKQ
ncbi:MAG: chromate transporter [Clostridia bacterium]|nr:chromate transporter [Clostridia bacterium]